MNINEIAALIKKEAERENYVEQYRKHNREYEKSENDIIMDFLENSMMCDAYGEGYDDGYIDAMRFIALKLGIK